MTVKIQYHIFICKGIDKNWTNEEGWVHQEDGPTFKHFIDRRIW